MSEENTSNKGHSLSRTVVVVTIDTKPKEVGAPEVISAKMVTRSVVTIGDRMTDRRGGGGPCRENTRGPRTFRVTPTTPDLSISTTTDFSLLPPRSNGHRTSSLDYVSSTSSRLHSPSRPSFQAHW